MERKNAIISGGAGFIGSHIARELIENEGFNKVYLIDNLVRSNSLRNVPEMPNVEFIYSDVSTFDFTVFEDITHFFHLAATRINRCARYNREGHESIACGGFNVVDYCTKNNVKLFFASTASVYNRPKRQPIQEADPCNPHTIYGAGKLYTENLIRSYDNMYGLDYTINRFFSIYGIGMDCDGVYTEVIFNWLKSIYDGNNEIIVYGNPDEKVIDLVYIDDAVDAVLNTTFNTNKDVFNVSTETGVTLTELIKCIEKVTDTKLSIKIIEEVRNDIEKKRVAKKNWLER